MKPKIDPDIIESEIHLIQLGVDATIVADIIIQQMRNKSVAYDQEYINLANAIRDWASRNIHRNKNRKLR